MSADEDIALLRRAAGGDQAAQAELYARLDPPMRSTIRRELYRQGQRRGPSQVDDLAQEVWAVLIKERWSQLLAFDPARGALEAYVRVIAAREVGNVLQKERSMKRTAPLVVARGENIGADHSPEEVASARQLASQLEEHFAEVLSERGRLVLRYVFTDGRKPDEVARILGLNLQVIYNWIFKIRSAATEFLSQP